MSAVMEGNINMGKKTKRMKWKIAFKNISKTDSTLKINSEVNRKHNTVDLLIHANKDKTVDVNGYILNGKKRKAVTIKNMQLTENAMKQEFAKLQ